MMGAVLDQAKALQLESARAANLWIKLAFLQDLIAEIERLEAAAGKPSLRTVKDVTASQREL